MKGTKTTAKRPDTTPPAQPPQDEGVDWNLVQKALDEPEIHSTYIEGWAGIGKTWAAMHFGRIQSGLFLCTLTDDMSASDLRGCWMPHGNGLEWHDGPVTLAMKRGARLVLNELPHASAETIDFLHPIIESRETAAFMLPSNELVRPAPGFNVVATGNQPLESLPFALRDRFDACLRVTRPHPDALGRLRPQLREAAQRTTVLEEERRLSVRSWLVLERLMDRWDLRDACTVVFGAERGVQVYEALVLAGEVER